MKFCAQFVHSRRNYWHHSSIRQLCANIGLMVEGASLFHNNVRFTRYIQFLLIRDILIKKQIKKHVINCTVNTPYTFRFDVSKKESIILDGSNIKNKNSPIIGEPWAIPMAYTNIITDNTAYADDIRMQCHKFICFTTPPV